MPMQEQHNVWVKSSFEIKIFISFFIHPSIVYSLIVNSFTDDTDGLY